MAWYGDDLTKLRVLAGLDPDDTSKDTDLTAAANLALVAIETYLDRKLELSLDAEKFFYQRRPILVRRWPIDPDVPVQYSYSNGTDDYSELVTIPANSIDFQSGILYPSGHAPFGYVNVGITYQGGFDPIPDDLLWCLYQAFSAYWYGSAGWGGTAGASSSGSGDIKKVSLTGIGSVDYDVGTTSSSSDGTFDPWSLIPDVAVAIMSRYRRESVVGVG